MREVFLIQYAKHGRLPTGRDLKNRAASLENTKTLEMLARHSYTPQNDVEYFREIFDSEPVMNDERGEQNQIFVR